ncbi:MAG TPA: acyl carrier protein [Kofleriaceae bacterium]|nr:acyl carrier protein [Kofleriaceae bacterium]
MKHIQLDRAESVARDLERFIRERFQIADDEAGFSRSVNLWEEGYVDSMGVVEVIAFLEQQFRVNLPEEVVFSPEFTNIDDIARFVVSLRAA